MNIEYPHENGITNIWPSPYSRGWFRWSNARGEGESPSFEDAVREAEDALAPSDTQLSQTSETQTLRQS